MSDIDYDIIILGSGPAGLQAAIHAARTKLSVMVLGRQLKSSLIKAHIENYCCILPEVAGESLLSEGRKQAEKFGTQFLNEDVLDISGQAPELLIKTESRELKTKTLILSMGISRHKLGVPGEKEYLGKGVSYCVECDANFFRNEPVVVVGGESAATSGALTLLFYTGEVYLVCQTLNVSETLAQQIRDSAIHLHEQHSVKSIFGSNQVEGIELDDGSRIKVSGVFIELGAKGAIELATQLGVSLDPESFLYITTNKKQETNIPGIYAAGDICGPPWQMAKAVGEGCVAGLQAASFVKQLRKTTAISHFN
jgi:thioredoxin reductase (NADPH)